MAIFIFEPAMCKETAEVPASRLHNRSRDSVEPELLQIIQRRGPMDVADVFDGVRPQLCYRMRVNQEQV